MTSYGGDAFADAPGRKSCDGDAFSGPQFNFSAIASAPTRAA